MKLLDLFDRRLWKRARARPILWLDDILPRLIGDTAGNYLFFDIGANEGQTIDKLRRRFPASKIHSFEPDPTLVAGLRRKYHGDPNIVIESQAMADKPSSDSRLFLNTFNQASSLLPLENSGPYGRRGFAERDSVLVAATTLDKYCLDNAIDKIDFVKIDTQGLSREILEGARRLISRQAIRVLQIELLFANYYVRTDSFFEIEKHLVPHGYHLHSILETDTDLIGSGYCDRETGALCHIDTLYVASDAGRSAGTLPVHV